MVDEKYSESSSIINNAITNIKKSYHPQKLKYILSAIFSQDEEIAIGAAIVLGRLKETLAVPYLIKALLTNNHKKAQAIMWALGEIGDETATLYLLEALSAGFAPKSAIRALTKLRSPQCLEVMINSLNAQDESVRALSAKCIYTILDNNKLKNHMLVHDILHKKLNNETSRRVKLIISLTINIINKKTSY